MELIIGGAYAGKLTYAVQKYGFEQNELFDLAVGLPGGGDFRCFYHLEALTKRLSAEGESAESIYEKLSPFLGTGAVVISREIGCGIVPMDAEERKYRETHGRLLRLIAESAGSVTRLFFGLEEKLK